MINEKNLNERLLISSIIYSTIILKNKDNIDRIDLEIEREICNNEGVNREITKKDYNNYLNKYANNLCNSISNISNKQHYTNTKFKKLVYDICFEEALEIRQQIYCDYLKKPIREKKPKREFTKQQLISFVYNAGFFNYDKIQKFSYDKLLKNYHFFKMPIADRLKIVRTY